MAAKNFSSELLFSVDWVLHRLCIVVSLYWDYIIRVQWPAIIIEHPNDYIYNYNLGKLLFPSSFYSWLRTKIYLTLQKRL